MTLPQANAYIEENKHRVKNTFRMKFHAMPELGWMNDPNGLVFYKQNYHIFYQFHPYDSVWGPMHWGHMISKDLIKFDYLPVALAPDQPDESGCFSGGAIVDVDNPERLYLLYTKHWDKDGKIIEQQGLAYTDDGIHFSKHETPVIPKEQIIPYGHISDARDPFPYYEDGYYYVFLGSKVKEQGKFLIYRSKNMIDFSYYDEIVDPNLAGCMAECPDLIKLKQNDVFIYSKVNYQSKTERNISQYFIGTFDLKQKKYHYQAMGNIDCGHHFYAPQTLIDPRGRTIMIGWMEMWGDKVVTHDLGHRWQGALSFPRVIEVIDHTLYQYPIEEIKEYYLNQTELKSHQTIEKNVDIFIEKTEDPFRIRFQDENRLDQSFDIIYDGKTLSVDGRTLSISPLPVKSSKYVYDKIELRILIDTSSFEIFVNQGKEAFTSRVYMDSEGYHMICSPHLVGTIHTIHVEKEVIND